MPSIPFAFECSRESGFVMDPNEHKRVGYIIALGGFKLKGPKGDDHLAADLKVCVPYAADAAPAFTGMALTDDPNGGPKTCQVVGVIEKLEWDGAVGGSLKFEFYVSQENATIVKAAQQMALKTTSVTKLIWWICDYDQEVKAWFDQSYPKNGHVTGIITGKDNPELDVDLNPVPVKDGIDVNVYKITMGVVPAANAAYPLFFANSSMKNVIKAWGLVVGTLAQGVIPP